MVAHSQEEIALKTTGSSVAKRAGRWPSSQTRRTAKSPGGRIVSDVIVSSNAKSAATPPARPKSVMESRPQARPHPESREAALERGIYEFSNPRREWRRLFSEVWGTFLLVLAAAGAGVVGALTGKITPAMAAAAPGLTVMAVIYFMGTVSGAHLNPGRAITSAMRRRSAWKCF
jgi:major intrinsic protein